MATDIEAAVKYPLNADDSIKTVLIGGALFLFSFLIVPLFLVYGYLLETLRAGMRGDAEPPSFEDWGTLLKEGVVVAIIGLVYGLIPLLVFALTVGGSVAAMATGTQTGAGVGIATMLGGMFVSFVLALVFGYFGLVGVAHYATERRFGAAFDVDHIRQVAFDRDYAVQWLIGVALILAGSVVTSVLGVIPLLGPIVGVFVTFYAQVVGWRVWGAGYADATSGIGGTSGTTDASVV